MKFDYLDADLLKDKFTDLLNIKLYDEELPNSRIKNIYEGKKYSTGDIVATVATKGDKFIGIILCESSEQEPFKAYRLKDPFRRGSKIKDYDSWSFVPLGFISMYVTPEYRNRGVAKELLHLLEDSIIANKTFKPQDVPLFTAAAKAVTFVADHSKYSHSVDVANNSVNFPSRIHFLREAVNSQRNNEEPWSIKCGQKLDVAGVEIIKKIKP